MSNARDVAAEIYELLPIQADEVKRTLIGNAVHIIKAGAPDLEIVVMVS